MTLTQYVALRLSTVLYEGWHERQVQAIAILAVEAAHEWAEQALDTLPLRRDLTLEQAAAWRSGIEDAVHHIRDGIWDTDNQ